MLVPASLFSAIINTLTASEAVRISTDVLIDDEADLPERLRK